MIEKTSTFQKVLEAIEALDPEDQAILVDIIQHRLKQQRRDELIKAVAEAREAYAKGEVRSGTVADLMAELES